ncbi:MAG: glycosyltransferase [Spirochaetales bacterium]|jgi:glycosyltransferase involved in cell wall biosynthesis|nr:glycosyltransferase [Spirochaetales bacterium]
MKKLRIAHITLSMGVGGIESLILNLCESMEGENLHFTVVCLDEGGQLLQRVKDIGAEAIVMERKPGLDVGLIFELVSLFRRRKFDVIHSHNQACAFYAGIAAFLARVPVSVVTEHSRHNTGDHLVRKLEKKFISMLVHTWVTVSNELAEKAVAEDLLAERKIKVIVNGVKLQQGLRHNEDVIRELGGKFNLEQKIIIVMVARLVPIKNHDMMLDALVTLNQDDDRYILLLVGDGPCRETLELKTHDMNLFSNVMFLGHRKDITKILSCADVFVLCSHSEGLPLALLEASSVGVPVVITEPSNGAGFISDGLNGRVVKQASVPLAGAIRACIEASDDSSAMAAVARTKVVREYSLEKTVQQYKDLYLSLLSRTGR